MSVKTSEPGNVVYLNVGVWYNQDDGQIHLTAKGVHGFHSTVSGDPKSKRSHSNLFGKLSKVLKDAGAPAPQIEIVDANRS